MDRGARESTTPKQVFNVLWSEPVFFWEVGVEIAEHAVLGLVRERGAGGLDEEGDVDLNPKLREGLCESVYFPHDPMAAFLEAAGKIGRPGGLGKSPLAAHGEGGKGERNEW